MFDQFSAEIQMSRFACERSLIQPSNALDSLIDCAYAK
jgi:hypothetical protein